MLPLRDQPKLWRLTGTLKFRDSITSKNYSRLFKLGGGGGRKREREERNLLILTASRYLVDTNHLNELQYWLASYVFFSVLIGELPFPKIPP